MKKRPPISEEERKLFRDAVEGVKPLKNNQKIPREKIKPTTNIVKKVEIEPSQQIYLQEGPATAYQASDYLRFSTSGLQHKKLLLLSQGKLPIEATLDLHGRTSDQAKLLLEKFLTQCLIQNARVVKVIHGKGQHQKSSEAILKNKVYGWLVECSEVLAFCSCQPKDGGTGALYVLLKRIK